MRSSPVSRILVALALAGALPFGAAAEPAEPAGPVNVNTADMHALLTLPGVGPAIAGRIVESRSTAGPFRAVDDLRRVKGIGAKTLDKLRSHVTVGDGVRVAQGPAPGAAPLAAGAAAPGDGDDRIGHGRGQGVAGAAADPVNVNSATVAELTRLPGIGPKTAEAIVLDRNDRGPFKTLDDLTRVKGIGKGKLALLRDAATTGP